MELSRTLFITNACSEKYEDIRQLFFSSMTKYFGYHRKKLTLEDVFFKTYKTDRILIQISATRPEIIGYAEISNAPYIPALEEDLWLEFLNFHYCCDFPLSATNTLFLNTFVYHKVYNPEMLKQLLCEIFYRDNNIKYIVVMECPDYRRYPGKDIQDYFCLETFAKTYYPKCFSAISCTNTQKLHVIVRDSVLPQMRYRKALPEDNDDIVEIVDYDHPELKKQLGEYYIAEELLSNEKSLLIVTEINHLTAGFVWFNDNVNLVLLLENYNLKEFGNLLKFDPKKTFEEKWLSVTTAKKRLLEKLFTTEAVNQVYQHVVKVPSSMVNVSNLSLCLYRIKTHDGNIIAVDEKRFIRDLALKRWEVLNERLKSYDYYVQLRRRQYAFYYNIPEGETNAACDANLNAFVIQLFGLLESYDPRQVFQFLLTAFAAFPDKDYCLISISLTSHITPVFLEMLKYFIRVIPRPGCSMDKHLFITHRSAVYGEISLYPVRLKDTEDIKYLLMQETTQTFPFFKRERKSRISTIADLISLLSAPSDTYGELTDNQFELEQVLLILKNIFEDPFSAYKCFTIRCGDSTRPIDDNTIVGFVIIRPFHLFCYLSKHFHVNEEDEFQNFLKAEIIILKLHSFFHFQADLILRELARQTHYCYFYYFRGIDRNYLANDLVTYMEPLEPRRIKKLWFNYFREYNQESDTHNGSSNTNDEPNIMLNNMDLLRDHFAGFTTNLRPSSNFGNSRNIVILGFTDICKAFLRLMIFSWHKLSNNTQASLNCLPQVNITVICTPGVMEADHEHAFKCETCSKETEKSCWINFKNSDAFIRDVCDRMDVRTWIRFVTGKIKSINNENHLIKMKSECEIYYETLLLMCGTDFGVPERIFKENASPPNYCHINNRFDKILFYHKLQILQNDLPKNYKKSIVVYGCHIRAFEFVNFLLKHNVQGSEIHFVIPFTKDNLQMGLMLNNSAEDCRIEEILREMLEDLGVKIYEFMNLSAYTLHDDSQNIKEVTFQKHISNEELILECDLFVSFYEVFLAEPLLEIFKHANIDTDHNFVMVDENYQTSVSNIYAMGNFIKHKTEPNHQYRFVSPQEAAEKVIDVFGLIDTEENVPPLENKFSKSSYCQAQLPLDYMFVKVNTPKRYLANHLDNEYGFPLVTYNEGEFSRVRLNEHGMVEEIVFVTKRKINFDFLKVFCGHHELLLNNLKSRWYLKDTINFIDFFQEPWTELLMHDRFEDLRTFNKNMIMKTAEEIVEMDIDRSTRRKLLYKYCQDLGITGQIEFAFLEFIRKYRKDFHTDVALPEDFLLPKIEY